MSQNPAVSGLSPTDAHPRDDRGSLERKRRHIDEENSPITEGRESVRSRPLSWHPSATVEPLLQPSQHRSIGVRSILNHPATEGPGRTSSVDSGREGLRGQLTAGSRSHSRLPSSSTAHLPSPLMHPANPPLLSPGLRYHQSTAPASPSARFAGATGYFPPKAGPAQSPLAQPLPRLQTVAPASPLPIDITTPVHPLPVSTHHHQTSTHSTSTFASHRASTNHTPTPSSKETSPTTPVSVFSQLGQSSPAIAAASAPPSTPLYLSSSPYSAVEPITRLPGVLATQRRSGDEAPGMGGAQSDVPPPGMIPCFLDLKSGSSSQAEKRKANSDASRRFRNRKRNEIQMEQKIAAQQDEMRKQAETIQKQVEELRVLMEQRDFYRSERDYFREQVARFVPSRQLPARPSSPTLSRPSSEAGDHQTSWTGSDVPRKVGEPLGPTDHQNKPGPLAPASSTTPGSAARPGGNWSTAPPSSYPSPSIERGVVSDERQTRPMPGSWNRTA